MYHVQRLSKIQTYSNYAADDFDNIEYKIWKLFMEEQVMNKVGKMLARGDIAHYKDFFLLP